MTRPGRDSGTPPRALTRRAGSGPSPGSRNSRSDRDRALRVIGLGLILHMLRSRRSYERAAFAAIVVGALAGMGQENQAKSLERLAAWIKRQDERVEQKVKEVL